ncbi:MAG: MFS transporter [Acidobacteriota bacterium]|nr:MFS transporter [Acidobacteriota bacterium]
MTRSSAARWGAVAIFALASTWNYLDRSVLSAAAPRIEAEFHLNQTSYGWVVSAFSFCYMLASPLAGWFLDRVGLETGIVWAVAFWSVAVALCGWTRSLGQLVAGRMFLGAWESAGVPAAGKLNAIYLEPKNRALGAAMTQVGLSIGGVAAPLLVRQFAGWRTSFFVCSALGLLWIPVWRLVRKNVAPYHPAPPRKPSRGFGLLGDRRLIALAAATMLWMVGYTLWSNWTTIYLVKSFGMAESQANAYAWFPPVASTLGAFAGGWISRRAIDGGRHPVRARIFGMLVSAFGCLVTLAAPFCPAPFWGTAVIAASYFWTTAGSVNLYTIPVDVWGSEQAGTAISALVFAYGLLQTVASPAIGRLVDGYGFAPVCWLIALPPFAGWLLLRWLPDFRPLPEIVNDPVR